jgi:hypothetical protein
MRDEREELAWGRVEQRFVMVWVMLGVRCHGEELYVIFTDSSVSSEANTARSNERSQAIRVRQLSRELSFARSFARLAFSI